MGSLLLILSLLFTLLIAVIAAANHQPVVVNYLFGKAEISLIVLIAGAAVSGALAMGLFSLYHGVRTALAARTERRRHEEMRTRLAALEQEKGRLRRELDQYLETAATVQEGDNP